MLAVRPGADKLRRGKATDVGRAVAVYEATTRARIERMAVAQVWEPATDAA